MCLINHEIPAEFYSFDKKAPFENCIICNRSLLFGSVPYIIEKSFKQYAGFEAKDIIYEYAMCCQCMMELSDELSVSSKASVQEYLLEHAHFNTIASVQKLAKLDVSGLLSRCAVKGVHIEEASEFTVYGMFRGGALSGPVLPYMMSAPALEEVSDCLSHETKEELKFFFDEFFAGPPEIAEILKTKPLIL